MNRELKFRVYHPDLGRLVYWSMDETFPHSDRYLSLSKYPVQQYTSLKDKNGKEIYEGDIVFVDDACWMVEFEWGCFGLKENDKDKLTPFFEYESQELVVVGNIFENPELLKS